MKKRIQNYHLYMYMSICVDAMLVCRRLCLIHIEIDVHDITKILVKMALSNHQTNEQTNKQTNKQTKRYGALV